MAAKDDFWHYYALHPSLYLINVWFIRMWSIWSGGFAPIIRFLFSARDARDIIPGCLVLACQEHAEGAIVKQTFVTSKQHVPAYLAIFSTDFYALLFNHFVLGVQSVSPHYNQINFLECPPRSECMSESVFPTDRFQIMMKTCYPIWLK